LGQDDSPYIGKGRFRANEYTHETQINPRTIAAEYGTVNPNHRTASSSRNGHAPNLWQAGGGGGQGDGQGQNASDISAETQRQVDRELQEKTEAITLGIYIIHAK